MARENKVRKTITLLPETFEKAKIMATKDASSLSSLIDRCIQLAWDQHTASARPQTSRKRKVTRAA